MRRGDLAEACERALFDRSRGAAPRQQLRAAARAFVRRHRRDVRYLAWVDPLDGETITYASPAIGDFDRDGDPDLFVGAAGGRFTYLRNQGSVFDPILQRLSAPLNPLASTDLGSDSAPAAADLDGDGDLDLVTGALDGTLHVHYFPEPSQTLLVAAGVALLRWLRRRAA